MDGNIPGRGADIHVLQQVNPNVRQTTADSVRKEAVLAAARLSQNKKAASSSPRSPGQRRSTPRRPGHAALHALANEIRTRHLGSVGEDAAAAAGASVDDLLSKAAVDIRLRRAHTVRASLQEWKPEGLQQSQATPGSRGQGGWHPQPRESPSSEPEPRHSTPTNLFAATRKSHFTHSPLVSRASLSFDDFSLESSSSDHSDSEAMLHVSTSGRPFGRTGMHSRFSPSPAARRAHSPLREFWPNSRAQQQQDADNKAREETSQDGRADSDTEGDENCSYSPEVSSKRTRMAADTRSNGAQQRRSRASPAPVVLHELPTTPTQAATPASGNITSTSTPVDLARAGRLSDSLAALEMLADVAAADAVTAKGSQNVDVMQVRASLRASVKEAAHSVSQLGSAADASATQQMLLRRALSRQGELLIEVQRSQQQYTACAEQLRQAKVESKETRSHARRQAALFDAQKQRVVEELQGAGQREQDLAEEASRSRAEAAELAAELARSQEVCKEMLAARRSARDALSDMAQQNARLVSAYVEKKQELRSIQEAVREERLQWQMRIEDLEAHLHAANSTSISLRTALAHRRTSPTSASPQQAQADGKQDCSPRASPHHDMGNAAGVESTSFPHQPAAETTDGASTHCDRHTPRTNGVCSDSDGHSPAGKARFSGTAQAKAQPSSSHGSHPPASASQLQPDAAAWLEERQHLLVEMARLRKLLKAQPASQPSSSTTPQAKPKPAQTEAAYSSPANATAHAGQTIHKADTPRNAASSHTPRSLSIDRVDQATAACSPALGTAAAASPIGMAILRAEASGSMTPGSIDASSPAAAASAERLRAITEQNEKLVRENCQLRQQRQAAEEKSRRAEARQQAERLKQVGNTAFQQQRYQPAADAYTAALELKLDDPAVNAVLYCNRAASLHALGKYVDAIADCFQAAALDPAYIRVYQRRADAYNAIGDYANAAQDLMALMQRGAGDVQDKLMDLQLRAKSHSAANHYAVLGVRPTATPAEVKAAYRQLALKYHPDKASTPTQKAAAEALFKLVSQANSVLSDTERKRQYDASLLRRKYRSRFAAYRF